MLQLELGISINAIIRQAPPSLSAYILPINVKSLVRNMKKFINLIFKFVFCSINSIKAETKSLFILDLNFLFKGVSKAEKIGSTHSKGMSKVEKAKDDECATHAKIRTKFGAATKLLSSVPLLPLEVECKLQPFLYAIRCKVTTQQGGEEEEQQQQRNNKKQNKNNLNCRVVGVFLKFKELLRKTCGKIHGCRIWKKTL